VIISLNIVYFVEKFRAKYRTNKVWGKVKNLMKFMRKTEGLLNFNFSSSKGKGKGQVKVDK